MRFVLIPALLALGAVPCALARSSAPAALPNFDAYSAQLDRQPAPNKVTPALGGRLAAHYDARMGLATFLWAQADEPAAAVGPLLERAQLEARARNYLRSQASALQLEDRAIDEAELIEAQYNGRGPAVVRFKQRVAGQEVFNRWLNVMIDRAGRPVAVSGYFAPGSAQDARAPAFELPASAAVTAALAQLGARLAEPLLHEKTRGAYQWFNRPALIGGLSFSRGPRVKPVLYPQADRLQAAYYVELFTASDADTQAYSFVISASDAALLFRKNLKSSAFTYRVYADPANLHQPYDSPLGNANEPFPYVDITQNPPRTDSGSQLVTLAHSPLISTADPWLPEGATETSGNNVDAYTDSALPDGYQPILPGTAPLGSGADRRGQITAPGVFDYPLVADMDPTSEQGRKAAAVTLFYVNNWLHDLYYDHGFNETAGVGQASNYGRGGEEGDAILAEGQDWSGRNNANMATPADGSAATMQMYLFDSPDSLPGAILIGPSSPADWDGTLDPLIIAHENMHYVSNRLVGDGNGLNNNQGGSMGEGWGDVASLLIAVREEDRALSFNSHYQGTYSVGVYVDSSFYYSIRRQPYSTDFSKNSFTFRHIADGEAAPQGAPTQGSGIGSAEVHDAGEIWANAMWSCWAGLLNVEENGQLRSFDDARSRFVTYLIAGLKMTPVSPTFTEARDGVLAAALATDERDFAACGRGFASRGMGMGAVSPDRSSSNHAGVIESYENFALKSVPLNADTRGARFGGSLGLFMLLPMLVFARIRRTRSDR